MRSPFSQSWVSGEVRGIALRGINVEDFRRLPIPLADSLEQMEINRLIAQSLSSIELSMTGAQKAMSLLQFLDQSVLTRAFRGELVPQDPNDEPVLALLEGIKVGGAWKAANMNASSK